MTNPDHPEPLVPSQKAGTKIEITPQMIEAGTRFLEESGRLRFEDALLDQALVGDLLKESLYACDLAPSQPQHPASEDAEGPCTDCYDTGITIQTERRCTCGAADPLTEPPSLADLIETRLLGILPDDQDLVLEDDDWRTIIAALRQPAAQVSATNEIPSAEPCAPHGRGVVEPRWQTEGDTSATTREEAMVTLRRDENGRPTVWCDPDIADLIDVLNTGNLATVASCSGHREKPGFIAMRDGRVMNLHPDLEAAKSAAAASGDVAGLREALRKCRDQFQFYVENHMAKGTPDGLEKAVANRGFVELCDAALSQPQPTEPARLNREGELEALRDLVRRAQGNIPDYYVNWHEDARAALSTKGQV